MTYSSPNLDWNHVSVGVGHEHHLETRIFFSGSTASAAWPANNLCLYLPIYIYKSLVVYSLWWLNGATVSGNACMGLYDENGNRITETTVVAQAGTSAPQEPSITSFQLAPGRYFVGLALSSTVGTVRFWNTQSASQTEANKWLGMGEETVTAAQVPTTMNPSASARGLIPILGLRTVSQAL